MLLQRNFFYVNPKPMSLLNNLLKLGIASLKKPEAETVPLKGISYQYCSLLAQLDHRNSQHSLGNLQDMNAEPVSLFNKALDLRVIGLKEPVTKTHLPSDAE
jgi:hypothetical protein